MGLDPISSWEILSSIVLLCPSSNFSPGGIILCPAYLLIRGNVCGLRLLGSFSREFMVGLPATGAVPLFFPCPCLLGPGGLSPSTVPIIQYLFTLVTPRCSFHSCKTHHPFLSMVINCEADNMYTTKIKPFSPTFQQPHQSFSCWSLFLCFPPVKCTICPVI